MSSGSSGGWSGCGRGGAMPEPAAEEVREQTFWCRVYRCPNQVPRLAVAAAGSSRPDSGRSGG